jgi:tRNA(Arg) A34 adenosine deaminase TadA
MRLALEEAQAAGARGEVPVGAVVASAEGAVLAREGNRVEALHDAGAHAEMLALRTAAAAVGQTRLTGCELWVTLEPCPMCAAAAALFRVRRVIFGAYDPKGGGIAHNARVYERPGSLAVPEVVGGVRETECGDLLKQFFKKKR